MGVMRLKSPASRCFTLPFIQAQIKENTKLRVTGLCAGNSPVTGEFSAQMASNAENVSIWWRHNVIAIRPLRVFWTLIAVAGVTQGELLQRLIFKLDI